MIRTQIYIPEDLHTVVNTIAKIKDEPMAKVLRDYIARAVVEEKRNLKPASLTSLAKLQITKGPKDLSNNMDRYLYQE